MLSSPDTAFQIVNGAYEKMLIELAIDEYIHIVELRLTSADNNSVTYEYCVDHNNDWGEIHYTFGEDDYDVVRYIYADKKGGFYFAAAGEWIMHNTCLLYTSFLLPGVWMGLFSKTDIPRSLQISSDTFRICS